MLVLHCLLVLLVSVCSANQAEVCTGSDHCLSEPVVPALSDPVVPEVSESQVPVLSEPVLPEVSQPVVPVLSEPNVLEMSEPEVQVNEQAELMATEARMEEHPLKGALDIICRKYKDFSLRLPFLPLLPVMGISISANNIYLEGLNNCKLTLFPKLRIHHDLIQLTIDPLILGGKLRNLPVTGRGKLEFSLRNMNINLKFKTPGELQLPPIEVKNVEIGRLEFHHDGLNPGQETGDLINQMISTLKTELQHLAKKGIDALLDKFVNKKDVDQRTEEMLTKLLSGQDALNFGEKMMLMVTVKDWIEQGLESFVSKNSLIFKIV